jgi:SAM-dependent methyltransferase
MECHCCKSKNISKKGEKNNFSIFHCKNCGFEFVSPVPSIKEIEGYYNNALVSVNIKDLVKRSIYDIDFDPNHPHRDWYDRILTLSKQKINKDRLTILDIGSSYGYFVHYANKLGHQTIGLEVSPEFAAASEDIINGKILYAGDKKYYDLFEPKSFDLIYMEHVFEHMINPETILLELWSILKDDGIIVMSVPNHASFLSKLFGINWDWQNPPLHLFFYNRTNLGLLLNRNKLVIDKYWSGEYFFRSIFQFYSTDILKYRMKQVINKLLNKKFKLEYRFNYPYKYPKTLKEFYRLLPYWLVFPVIFFLSKLGYGTDLTLIIKKKT